MLRLFFSVLFIALSLAACEQNEDAAPPAQTETEDRARAPEVEAAPAEPQPVRAEIFLGQFESDVTDLAAWEARPFGFQSQIFAANGEAGITLVRADGGGAASVEANPVAVYLATAEADDGEALLLTLAGDGTLEAFTIGDLSADARRMTQISAPRDLCSDGFLVIAVAGSGARAVLGETTLPLSEVPGDALGCALVGGDAYFLSPRGWDRLSENGLEPTPLSSVASTLIAAGSQVFAVGPDGQSGELSVNDQSIALQTPDGEELRPLMVAPAYGNFGGVLRDGALIVLDEQRNLYLVGWAGIGNALGLPAQLTSLREPMTTEEVEFTAPETEIQVTQPEFEEQEAPLPPGQNR